MNGEATKFYEWVCGKQDAIDEAVLACFDSPNSGSWIENTITAAVLKALGTQENYRWADREQRTSWQTCKLAGESEAERGDIAIRVRIHLTDAIHFDGVAFYEAKRAFYDQDGKTVFASIDEEQLERLHGFSFGDSNVLLYQVLATPVEPRRYCGDAQVIPLSFLQAYKKANRVPHSSLRALGAPFMEILMRHLMGFHLDTRPEALQAFEDGLGRFTYVITAETAMTPKITHNLSARWNRLDLYVPLAQDSKVLPDVGGAGPVEPDSDELPGAGPDTPKVKPRGSGM